MTAIRAFVAVAVVVALAGCQGEMRDVLTLKNTGDLQPPAQVTTVKQKGTYWLYSTKDDKQDLFHRDLRKGDEIGFRVRGNRVIAVAAGTMIELEDYSEGASYVWRLEEKRE